MKKIILIAICMMLGLSSGMYAQTELNTVWERTDRTGADGAPEWFTAGFNRGLAMYGDQIFVADRSNSQIHVLDATTGGDVTLDTPFDLTMVAGGTYPMNDLEASDDGFIFLGNLVVDASSSAFNLYIYDAAGGDTLSTYSITTTEAHRLGDRFTVVGSVADNTVEIWIPAQNTDPGVIYKVTTADNGTTWDLNTLTLSGDNPSLPSNADVEPLAAGGNDFYIAGNGSSPKRFTTAGEYVANSQFASVSFNGSKNGFDFFVADGVEHLAVYSYRPDPVNAGNKTGYVSVYSVEDVTAPTTVFESPLMGDDVDTFSSIYGEVKVRITDQGLLFYALEGVNGLAAYTNVEPQTPANLFFSEYIEGSGNNKALEIYNPTDAEVSLSGFTIEQTSNGDDWGYYHYFPEGATIAAGDVYVVITDQVDTELFDHANADEVLGFPSPVHHNGNDARAITFIDPVYGDTTRLDVIGDPNSDAEWNVAGVAGATGEHTLLRKSSVITGNPTPLASFGTDEASSEWVVLEQDDFSNLGMPTQTEEPGEAVSVTFIANTSTLPDTLQSYHFLQVRGAVTGPNSAGVEYGVAWDAASSAVGENIGGDYWNFRFEMSPGDTLNYKLFAGFDTETGTYNGSVTGWESGDNRQFILPADFSGDTTMTLWYETRTNPFEEKEDSVGIKFRVNMGAQAQLGDFDPESDLVGVRGVPEVLGNPVSWSSTAFYLEQENPNGEGDNLFYSGILYVPDTLLQSSPDRIFDYKFVYETTDATYWEDGDNSRGIIPSSDTTFQWKFFSNQRVIKADIIEHTLNFEVDLSILSGLGMFTVGYDSVYVRGSMNGWSKQDDYLLSPTSDGAVYQLRGATITAPVGDEISFKYYVQYPPERFDETSENYFLGINILGPIEQENLGFEEPGVTFGANRIFKLDSNTAPKLVGEHHFNGVPSAGLLTDYNVDGGATEVTFRVNMSNATSSAENSALLFNPASDSVWIFLETKYFAFTQGGIPGTIGESADEAEKFRMTDSDGDMVYELTLPLNLPTVNHIGFTIGYGSNYSETGIVVRNGGGFDAGRRYYQYLTPTEVVEMYDDGEMIDVGKYSSSYTLQVLDWAEENLPYEEMPDYDEIKANSTNNPNPSSIELYTSNVGGFAGEELMVPVYADIEAASTSSMEFEFANFAELGTYTGVYTDSTTLFEANGWTMSSNFMGDTLLVAAGGVNNIDKSGVLFYIGIDISPDIALGEYYLDLFYAGIDENTSFNFDYYTNPINISSPMPGDVSMNGEIRAYDASLVLKWLVGNIQLSEAQRINGDVTEDDELTALDASYILDYVVELVDFPIDETPEATGIAEFGSPVLDKDEAGSTTIDVPVMVRDLANVKSLTGTINLGADWYTNAEFNWSDDFSKFQREFKFTDGDLKIAAAGPLTEIADGSIGTLRITVESTEMLKDQSVRIAELRWNEAGIQQSVSDVDLDLLITSLENAETPTEFSLGQNYPNPFNPSTTINFALPQSSDVQIVVYDMLGKTVATVVNKNHTAGKHSVTFNASQLSSGIYFYQIKAGSFIETRKMTLIK